MSRSQSFEFILRQQLKLLLSRYHISPLQLSQCVGIPNTTLANWLEGRKPRNIDQLKAVASYFNLSVDALCYGSQIATESKIANCQEGLDVNLTSFDCYEGLTGLFEIKLHKILKK